MRREDARRRPVWRGGTADAGGRPAQEVGARVDREADLANATEGRNDGREARVASVP